MHLRPDSSTAFFVLFLASFKSEWARHTWECVAPIHIRGYCPHPSNHLRRRIHQPSLLPRNIHRNACAVQVGFFFGFENANFAGKDAMEPLSLARSAVYGGVSRVDFSRGSV